MKDPRFSSENSPNAGAVTPAAPVRNHFNRMEWAGAFGDLGTFIPFITAYIGVMKMDAFGILLGFGISLIICGWFYRTPFPVQPMKAIGAVATTQAAQVAVLGGGSVIAAGFITGIIWLILGLTGMVSWIARIVAREVVIGIVLGLGMSFMLEGAKMMASNWILTGAAFIIAILLRTSRLFPAMFVLLLGGFLYSLIIDPTLLVQLKHISFQPRMPALSFPSLSLNDFMLGLIYLALPQLPLTLGNAIIGTKEENNRLFPDRPVTVRGVAISTGIMNLFGAAAMVQVAW
jgi:xanthine/uracil/vitamin C permease (AzgA family)